MKSVLNAVAVLSVGIVAITLSDLGRAASIYRHGPALLTERSGPSPGTADTAFAEASGPSPNARDTALG